MKELRIFLVVLMLAVLIAIPFRWEDIGVINRKGDVVARLKIDRFINQGWCIEILALPPRSSSADHRAALYAMKTGEAPPQPRTDRYSIIEYPISPGYSVADYREKEKGMPYQKAWRKRKAINVGMGSIFVLSFLLYLASFPYERRYLTKT